MMNANELFYDLRVAVATGDAASFESLCKKYAIQIAEHFKTWTKVPEPVRSNEAQTNIWAATLMQVAQHFESKGNSALFDLLVGNRETNPVSRLQNSYMEAQGLFNGGKYRESISLLQPLIAELKTMKGPFADKLTGMVYGLAGSNYLKSGLIDEAEEHTSQALENCKRFNDAAGVTVYDQNMQLIQAYKAYSKNKNSFLIEVRNEIVRAQKLSDSGSFRKSTAILDEISGKVSRSSDPLIQRYHSKIYGLTGLNYFRINEFATAEKFTLLALQMAEKTSDRAGTFIYSENLKKIKSML